MQDIKYNSAYDAQLGDLFFKHKLTCGKILKSKKCKELHDYVMSCTQFLDIYDVSLSTRMFYVMHHA